ncbi:hypothetical protein WMF30_40390 [Sorangium sp. So ce134]
MGADLLALVGVLEELRAVDAGELEMSAEALGRMLDTEEIAVLVNEERRRGSRVAAEREPCAQRLRHAGRQRPCARVVRLVLLEAQRAAIQVDVLHLQACRLADAGALAVQKAPEDAPAQRDRRASQQARVLVGVEARLRLRGAELREEAAGERVRREETAREDGHRHEPVQELRDVTARCGGHRRERAHDALGVVEREGCDGDAAGDRVDVAVETIDVLLDAALRLDVVGVHARELARGPELAELLESDLLRHRVATGDDLRLCAASADDLDRRDDVPERSPLAHRSTLQQRDDRVACDVPRGAQAHGQVGDELLALLGLLLGQLGVEREALAVVVADEDANVEPTGVVAEERSRGPAGHGGSLLPRFAAALTPAAARRRRGRCEAGLTEHRRCAAAVLGVVRRAPEVPGGRPRASSRAGSSRAMNAARPTRRSFPRRITGSGKVGTRTVVDPGACGVADTRLLRCWQLGRVRYEGLADEPTADAHGAAAKPPGVLEAEDPPSR